ncbi:ecdysteroid 22-kinase family protein [Mycobacterium sp. GA-1285]|uniref:ecdysteroid 22-kinase family protein n=1 Tax=Mycobacterium sp. GA-1285 TaxID=1772282 RepID=UPI0020A30123|nr:ecdysteroid 22-kinase family protein [Mycobacterium sp. GA-1285]
MCKLEQFGIGVGLLGRLYRAHLDGDPDLPSTVVVKLPTLDVTARTNLCENLEFYRREVRFYQEIGAANPVPPARSYFAAFDEATHDFVLVLEDLARLRNVDQLIGCSVDDAEIVVDAIARHHAYWWESDRLEALPWLKAHTEPPFPDVAISNYQAAWPKCVERLGSELTPAIREYGNRFATLVPWFLEEVSRRPQTFLHGDLRLDQMFFATSAGDPPLTVLDWQVTNKGRGAFDVGYFLSQSLTPETRRTCEDELLARYRGRLAEHKIDYPAEQLRQDYRIATAWCFVYPVMAEGRIEIVNDRNKRLVRAMFRRAAAALEDHDAFSLGPG